MHVIRCLDSSTVIREQSQYSILRKAFLQRWKKKVRASRCSGYEGQKMADCNNLLVPIILCNIVGIEKVDVRWTSGELSWAAACI